MPQILFFDTETNGLPNNFNAPATDVENWPRIVQLAYSVYDDQGNQLDRHEAVINPDGWTVPADMIHGISHEFASDWGLDMPGQLDLFLDRVQDCDYLVAHNMGFDYPVLMAEYIRYVRTGKIGKRKADISKICTMRSTVDFCRLPGRNGFKWPRLSELHYKLFGCDFDGAHDAMNDVNATAKCFFELINRGVIVLRK